MSISRVWKNNSKQRAPPGRPVVFRSGKISRSRQRRRGSRTVVNAEGVAKGRQRRRRSQTVVNAEGVAKGRQRRRRSQVSAQGCFNPGLASIAKGNAEGVG